MLKQLFRVVLLCATGGHLYYGQLWDVGMVYCNMIINHRKWSDRESPISQLTGQAAVLPEKAHVFGAYCLFTVPKEVRGGTFRPKSEMGVWVGIAPHSPNHWVCPIEWDSTQQAWIIHDAVVATTVKVYDEVLPLRMKAPQGRSGTQEFDRFVSAFFNPLLPALQQGEGGKTKRGNRGGKGTRSPGRSVSHPEVEPVEKGVSPYESIEDCEVESILDKRSRKGVVQYKVKWLGWDNRYNCWVSTSELDSPDLIAEYESAHVGMSRDSMVQSVAAIMMCMALAALGLVGQTVLLF